MRTTTKYAFKEFARTHSWAYQMDNSGGLDGRSNYSGGMEHPDWVVSCGRNRDSDLLQESNFDAALERLGGESKHVIVERFGHWGCGWFELILVNPRSQKHLAIAHTIHIELEAYPVLDESDFSEREWEYQSNFARENQKDLAEAISIHFGLKPTRALVNLAYELNIECQAYAGNDACINVYKGRKPDQSDVRLLRDVMTQLEYRHKRSPIFKRLQNAVKEAT